MSSELVPASRLPLPELAALFTASFEGYAVPMDVDGPALARMVELYDLDLEASRVALRGGRPVGLANLGIRGDVAWIGGMGVVRDTRRRGTGELLMHAVHEQARARGVREVVLEVIESNEAAGALCRKLGYEHVRQLELWSLDGEPAQSAVREVAPDEAHGCVRELRREPEPWQRDDATLERLLAAGADLRGLLADGGAAVLRVTAGGGAIEQLAAADTASAASIRRCSFGAAPSSSSSEPSPRAIVSPSM